MVGWEDPFRQDWTLARPPPEFKVSFHRAMDDHEHAMRVLVPEAFAPQPPPKYSTLTELVAAFKSKELNSTFFIQIMEGGERIGLFQQVDWNVDEDEEPPSANLRYDLFLPRYKPSLKELLTIIGVKVEDHS